MTTDQHSGNELQETSANSLPSNEPAEPRGADEAEIVVRVVTDDDRKIGADIQVKLEKIFGRANEGMPLFEELGSIEGIAKTLDVDLKGGLDPATVEHRRAWFGANELPKEDPITFWQILLGAWSDHMIILLTVAAIISLILGLTVPHDGEAEVDRTKGWIEGFSIILSVLIVTTVSSVNDYRKEQEFRKLTEENSAQPITAIRGGVNVTIDVSEIVVGDLVVITPGLVMPVDGFYVSGMSVVVDESSVTGENDPKRKSAKGPFFLTGTVVNTAEQATILAGAVGVNSFGGKLLMEARGDGETPATPLQNRLDDLAGLIGRFGLGAALILFIALSIIEIVRFANDSDKAEGTHFLDYFLLCVAIVVVAVPEGLPLAVTIALAYSQKKMHDDNNQVRRLRACETMGNATQICSDKTGTLTQNLMSVVQAFIGGQYIGVKNPGEHLEKIDISEVDSNIVQALIDSISINSSSSKIIITQDKDHKTIPARWWWENDKGNKTDNALLDFVDRVALAENDASEMKSLPHQRQRAKFSNGDNFMMFPFTSDRKRMSAVIRLDNGKLVQYVKGGADQVLPLCTHEQLANGTVVELTDARRVAIDANIKDFAQQANRNIGVAFANVEGSTLPEEEPEGPLTWLALIGIQDPLRPEVKEAVRKCQHAGVVVRMCTGDNIDTAIAISKQCGIFSKSRGDIAMSGKEFRHLVYNSFGDDEKMKRFYTVLDKMTVMARSQPLDKQLLVLMLMCKGEVVAVTGDGTNDAPALRLANVGFVMRSGTDIAVKSADIILLDDNFRSVQRAVVWGRCVNDNIRKFLQLQLTINVVSVLLTFIGSLQTSENSSPLTTVQLLWVNLIMDTLAALSLATEQPSELCLNRGPVHRKASLVTRRMWVTLLTAAAYSLAATLVILNVGADWFGVGWHFEKNEWIQKYSREHLTIVFNVFVYCALFQMINARKLYREINVFEGFSRSIPFVAIFVFCCGFQALAVEFFGDFMKVTNLNWKQWLGCIAAATPVIPLVVLSRLIPIPEEVFPSDFDPEDLESEAKSMVEKLANDVAAHHAEEDEQQRNEHLSAVRKMHVRGLWDRVRAHHVQRPRVIRAFRRARAERDLHSDVAVNEYRNFVKTT
ncbi:vacuolar-type Ca2+-ATPase, putative [Bodo saltans]|uniref:Vacuolar-type Ca2+-ATPase, putative n=1 Tax=Bodo saltans TaxID=75058 RepID=A0A0S4KNQ6_BODSA|nr:vacuolar-type Ca2+-ATPase, putative [Bodo saltans]|eukprot:CUI14525.1 vacuolar-type Ca2+-ATPase, putative [Bodo saltans]